MDWFNHQKKTEAGYEKEEWGVYSCGESEGYFEKSIH